MRNGFFFDGATMLCFLRGFVYLFSTIQIRRIERGTIFPFPRGIAHLFRCDEMTTMKELDQSTAGIGSYSELSAMSLESLLSRRSQVRGMPRLGAPDETSDR